MTITTTATITVLSGIGIKEENYLAIFNIFDE
jgi:hypothetical protein